MELRVSARPGLLSGQFRCEGLHVRESEWATVDAKDPKVRAALLAYVPSHVRVAIGQDPALVGAGLELRGGRLVDLDAEKAAAKSDAEKAKRDPKAPRAEK